MSEKLSDVVTIISGGTPKTSVKEFWDGDIDWLAVADFNSSNRYVSSASKKITDLGLNNSNTKMLEKGDLIISARGTVGAIAQLTKPMAFNQSCFGLRGKKDKLDTDYLYYWLKNYVDVLLNKSQGSVFNTINLSTFDDIKIELPSIVDQRKISNLLTLLDDKISLNNQINQELEAMAKTLYDYWFVQFDFPDQNDKPYKSSGGKMVYHPELKREIPEGWGVSNLFDAAEVQYGYPFSTDYFNSTGAGVPVIRIRDILGNDITNYSTEEVEDKYRINVGDVLIGMDGNFHMNYWIKENCYLNQRVVKVNSDKLPNMVLKYQIEPFIKLREKSVSRTTVGHLSDKDLKAINVILPKEKNLSPIFERFESILKNIIINQQQNQELTRLRDWLLPMLMNGQVKVEKRE